MRSIFLAIKSAFIFFFGVLILYPAFLPTLTKHPFKSSADAGDRPADDSLLSIEVSSRNSALRRRASLIISLACVVLKIKWRFGTLSCSFDKGYYSAHFGFRSHSKLLIYEDLGLRYVLSVESIQAKQLLNITYVVT